MGKIFTSPYASSGPFPDTSIAEFWLSNPYGVDPKRVCVFEGGTDRTLTFQDLSDNIRHVSSGLRKVLGVKPGDVVFIMSGNNIPYITLPVAVTAAGAVPSMISPAATAEETAHCLSLVAPEGARYLIVAPALLSVAKEAVALCKSDTRLVSITEDGPKDIVSVGQLVAAGKKDALPVIGLDRNKTKSSAEALAMIFYSSGTTGKFKGVMLSHRNLISNAKQLIATSKPFRDPSTTLALFLPYYHIYGTCQIFGTALTGTRVVHMAKFDLPLFLECIQKHKVTRAPIVPPVAVALAKHPIVDKYDLSSLKSLGIAAAPTKIELQEQLANRLKVAVVQGYGMTEASPGTHQLDPEFEHRRGSVGQLFPDMECRIVNDEGKDVGVDEEGEIVLRGPNIMLGYIRNPEATAETVKDGWLFTGDIGRVDKEGFYWIVDRKKELIKVKGFQVAPAELEGVLLACPLVQDCAVTSYHDGDRGTEFPRAFIVVEPGKETAATAREIAKFVEGRVAHYKRLAGGVFFLPEIPKNPSGKILRRLLPKDPTPPGDAPAKAKL